LKKPCPALLAKSSRLHFVFQTKAAWPKNKNSAAEKPILEQKF